MTAGVAVLSLYAWLLELRAAAQGSQNPTAARGSVTGPERGGGGGGALPARLAIVTDCGKGCREQGNLVVKEAVAAVMIGWGSPFRCAHLFKPCDMVDVLSDTAVAGASRVVHVGRPSALMWVCGRVKQGLVPAGRPPTACTAACWRRRGLLLSGGCSRQRSRSVCSATSRAPTRPPPAAALWCGAVSSCEPCSAGLWEPFPGCTYCRWLLVLAPAPCEHTNPCIKPWVLTTGQRGGGRRGRAG